MNYRYQELSVVTKALPIEMSTNSGHSLSAMEQIEPTPVFGLYSYVLLFYISFCYVSSKSLVWCVLFIAAIVAPYITMVVVSVCLQKISHIC